ncbi:AAEL015612-PA [Aedes aegypti]|uniref:AAEL015612-PA n=1 Tax=Aedes aegypti TaxID=7159 RepID=Q1DGJ1_AEDAE|nr:AAEL015612-PA [Aedes aegypti]
MATVVKCEPIDMEDPSATPGSLLMMESGQIGAQMGQRQDMSSQRDAEKRRDDKLQMMQTDEDPLLQETINALISGSGGIEAVSGGGVPPGDDIDNERNYECNFCGKLFTRSNTLSYHLKVHNDEKPYKCGSCDKAFREQYRLTKHQKTHSRDLPQQDQEAEQSQDSSFPSISGRTAEEEDYTTGDSERFFRNYELQEDTAVMKLEPDISLTVDSGSTNTGTQSSSSDNDVRYQIIEERIKSLQREVHLVNQNLNRVETKLDGLTKIMAMFINKFDEVDSQPNNASNSNAMIPIPMISLPLESLQPAQPTVTVSVPPPQPQSSPVSTIPTSIQMITTHHPVVAPMAAVQQQQHQPQFVGNLHNPTSTNSHNSHGSSAAFQQQTQQQTTTLMQSNDTFPEVPDLPIRTVSDFLDLNDHCTDNEQFLLQMWLNPRLLVLTAPAIMLPPPLAPPASASFLTVCARRRRTLCAPAPPQLKRLALDGHSPPTTLHYCVGNPWS